MRRCPLAQSPFIRKSRLAFLAVAVCIAVSACGSDGEDPPQPLPVDIDESAPLDDPVSGSLNEDLTILAFRIDEDDMLVGLFADPRQGNPEDEIPLSAAAVASSSIRYSILSLPQSGRLTISRDGDSFRYDPDADYFGEDSFVYATSDDARVTAVIDVVPVPDAPILNSEITTVAEQGRLYSVVLEATDNDGDELRFSAMDLPDWLSLDTRTGVLSGVPQQSDIGLVEGIALTVSDGTGLSDTLDNLTLQVVDINDPPSLNTIQVPRELFGRESVEFNVFPDDLDDDEVTISVDQNAAFEVSVDVDGLIKLQVNDINQVLSTQLTIIARDEKGAVTREVLALDLYPRTASGNGITVSGFRNGRGVHVVILGDGYARDQQQTFRDHVDDVLENIRSDEGIAEHLGGLNIHMIETVSAESGSDDSDARDTVDTAFDSAYNCRSIPRLVCADTLKMFEASLEEYPNVDQLILLVNDRRFGGSGNSGGRVAITSAFFPEIALHEMGHSLADLADEYVDPLIMETSGLPPFTEGRYANVSTLTDPSLVPWTHWIDASKPLMQHAGEEGVGVFEGGLYRSQGVYRGTYTSRMRDYAEPFGPINTEQWILRLYMLTDGIREFSPQVDELQLVSGQLQEFLVEPIFGSEVQAIEWTLNGESLVQTGNSATLVATDLSADPDAPINVEPFTGLELSGGSALQASSNENASQLYLSLAPGIHQLSVRVSDISGKIQVRGLHAGIFTWRWRIVVQ